MRPFTSQATTGITVVNDAGKPGSSGFSSVAATTAIPRRSAVASNRASKSSGWPPKLKFMTLMLWLMA